MHHILYYKILVVYPVNVTLTDHEQQQQQYCSTTTKKMREGSTTVVLVTKGWDYGRAADYIPPRQGHLITTGYQVKKHSYTLCQQGRSERLAYCGQTGLKTSQFKEKT